MGRKPIDYESTRLTFHVPKELKCKLKEELTPVIRKKIAKWKKENQKKRQNS